MAALAEQLGVGTPTIKALVQLQLAMSTEDLSAEELTLEQLGLAGLTVEQIRRYVETGERP
jgi:hypothetical protein